jgi:hypothetical protein
LEEEDNNREFEISILRKIYNFSKKWKRPPFEE